MIKRVIHCVEHRAALVSMRYIFIYLSVVYAAESDFSVMQALNHVRLFFFHIPNSAGPTRPIFYSASVCVSPGDSSTVAVHLLNPAYSLGILCPFVSSFCIFFFLSLAFFVSRRHALQSDRVGGASSPFAKNS